MPPTSQLCARLTSALQGSLSGLRSRLCAQGSGRAWRVGQRTKTAEDTVTGPQAAASPALCFVCSSSTGRGVQVAGVGGERGSGQGRQEALPFAGGLRPAASVMTSPLRSLLSRPVAPSGLQTKSSPLPVFLQPLECAPVFTVTGVRTEVNPSTQPCAHPSIRSFTRHRPCALCQAWTPPWVSAQCDHPGCVPIVQPEVRGERQTGTAQASWPAAHDLR